MAKRDVKVVEVPAHEVNSRYKRQWKVDASPTKNNPSPEPYTVSEPRNGDMYECDCMSWTRNHPREDCKHILRVKMMTAAPVPVAMAASTLLPTYSGRKMR